MKTINKVSAIILAVSLIFGLAGPITVLAATTPPLGASASFSVLAQTAITNVPTSVISGDVGLNNAGTNYSGLTTGEVAGTIYDTNNTGPSEGLLPVVVQPNAVSANGDMLSQPISGAPILGALDGVTRGPGVYDLGAGILGGGVLTLDGPGVYIFRTSSSLTSAGSVNLINGARACDVFWSVNTLATINSGGAGTSFAGTIIAGTGVHFGAGAVLDGRALAVGGDVTLISNTITGPSCAAAPATLHVIKLVVNGSGGTAVASNFNVHVKNAGIDVAGSPAAGVSAPGTSYSLSAGTYAVSEDASTSYVTSFSGDCNSSGSIALAPGDDKICTIINTDIPLPAPVPAPAGGGGTLTRIVPLIGILKVPTPLALPAGSGAVTYDYSVWNVGGQQSLADVTVTDDKCNLVSLVSGDLNSNNLLDVGETWKYRCSTTLYNTTTNTAVAIGYSNDFYHQPAVATAIATVVVGVKITPPIINIVKVPSRLTPFPFGGGDVTYTYTVTNPGVEVLDSVTVTDDKCSPVSRTSGDANGNNLLESSEKWIYTCRTNIPVSTRNIATAEGKANGLTAIAYAFANVLVSAPGLPNTGVPPEEGNGFWNILMISVAILSSASIALFLKKRST